MSGKLMSCQTLIDEVDKDIPFYEDTGGITFSGGEATSYPNYVTPVLKYYKKDARL